MLYRREIDGLRALAVLPVILFHADLGPFSGGFVGVDVFFVISGYLISSNILTDLDAGRFSIVNFYERRVRRILPALFFVMLMCLPMAWLWLGPKDMREFSQSLTAVSLFSSNIFFWRTDGYFDTSTALKPLLHTWSLAVEEQYYLIYPILLGCCWRYGRRWIITVLVVLFICSLGAASLGSSIHPAANFYLLPTRAWELLIGSFAAFYVRSAYYPVKSSLLAHLAGWEGLALILYAMLQFDASTPFPSFYTLVPTVGAALVILFARRDTLPGRLLGSAPFVFIGLISYSAYLWHQPLFAFARHASVQAPSPQLFGVLVLASLVLAFITWRFVEKPFRNSARFSRRDIFLYGGVGSVLFIAIGLTGHFTDGFSFRYQVAALPVRPTNIACHWEDGVRDDVSPLASCLGKNGNGKGGDVYLIGDSHATHLTYPLRALAAARNTELYFINTARGTDFPHAFWREAPVVQDRLFEHVLNVADKGDKLVIAFHRGHFNASRDTHVPMAETVSLNRKSLAFLKNMDMYLPRLADAGLRIYLVKDAPLLSEATSLEKCAFLNSKTSTNFCSITLAQDRHTRWRQSAVFDTLAARYPASVVALDPFPTLYGGQSIFNPIYADGAYKMFDRHHLSERGAMELVPYFDTAIPHSP